MKTVEETGTVAKAATPPHATGARPRPDEDRLAFDASWEFYLSLCEAIGDQHVLSAYDGQRIELMSPGYRHEDFKSPVERLVGALTAELGVSCKGTGSTRWHQPDAGRGIEADLSFYFTTGKIAGARKVAAMKRRPDDPADDPCPDMAAEVDIRASLIDRPSIYAALGVPEVWRFDGETLRIDRLGPDGAYADAPESGFLGVRPSEIDHLLLNVAGQAEDDNDFSRRVAAWAREVLVPRRATNGGA